MDENNNKNNDFISTKPNFLSGNRNFKSVINSDLMTKILKHCQKDVKYEIMTQRINSELDGNYSGEDDKIRKTHNIIKLNF